MSRTSSRHRDGRRIRLRLLALQVAIVLGTVVAVAAVVLRFEDQRIRDLAFEEVDTVATAIAAQPDVIRFINSPQATEEIQPIAHLAEEAAGVAFVVVVDRDGVRVAHPEADQVGRPVSSDHGPIRSGETFRGVEEGPLGTTLRSKVPIWDGDTVVGTLSVGIQQSEIRRDLLEVVLGFAPWVLAAAALGTAAAAWASRYVRTRIYGANPEEMGALHQSHQALLHSVGDGVVGVDEHGTVSLVNDEARRLLGATGELEGHPATEVLEPDVAALLLAPGAPPEATGFVLSGERILLAKARPALAQGQPIGRTLTLQDRTELESTFRELEGQRSMTEALRSQTHEFSNRLHVISGLLALGEAEEAQEYIRGLTGPLGSAGTAELEDASLSALVGAKASVAREAGVELALAGTCSVAPGWKADDDVLTVVANLLTNAIEAAGDGGRVCLEVLAGPAGLRVAVDDSGPGVAPALAQRLFRWGESTKDGTGGGVSGGTADGTDDEGGQQPLGGRGVGLALVDRIARRRRGRVSVTGSPLGGARFEATWPGTPGTGPGEGPGTGPRGEGRTGAPRDVLDREPSGEPIERRPA